MSASSDASHFYLEKHDLTRHMDGASHILWTTGGLFVPPGEYDRFARRGARLCRR